MLSVVHVLSSLSLGGAERVVLDLAEFQRRHNLDAQILSFGNENDFFIPSVQSLKVPYHIDSANTSRIRRYIRLLKLLRRFDVVHIHSRGAFKFIGPLFLLLRFSGVRIIYTRHGLLADNTRDLRILYRLFRPFVDYVTFVTESGKDVFSENHKWNSYKLLVIRNGIEVPEVIERKHIGNPVRFGSVGRMELLKGQLMLLDAMKLLDGEDFSQRRSLVLKFFGEGPLEDELRIKAKEIKTVPVEFCGQQPDLDKLYQEIDVLIVVSDSEGLSMAILEAMSRGIPTIATDVGGNPTLVRNEETGILLADQNKQLLYDAMVKFLEDPELIEVYGNAGRSMVRTEFTLKNTHDQYLECYRS